MLLSPLRFSTLTVSSAAVLLRAQSGFTGHAVHRGLRFRSLHESKVAVLVVWGLQDARASGHVHGRQHYFAARFDHTLLGRFDVVDGEVELPVRRNTLRHAGALAVHHSAGIEGLVSPEGLVGAHGSHVVRSVLLPAVMPGV